MRVRRYSRLQFHVAVPAYSQVTHSVRKCSYPRDYGTLLVLIEPRVNICHVFNITSREPMMMRTSSFLWRGNSMPRNL